MKLLPYPRKLKRTPGAYVLPEHGTFYLPPGLPRGEVLLPVAQRLAQAAADAGSDLELVTGPSDHPEKVIEFQPNERAPVHPEGYLLQITKKGIKVFFREIPGIRAALATLRQLLREFGRNLPLLEIQDYPDFPRRGVMLDVSRGRVPNLETLIDLAERLADFKINELQLYLEHTFAYRHYEPVWKDWGALTPQDILQLDQRCRQLGIDLVPNQNSFGHLRYWLEYSPLKELAEVREPYLGSDGTFLRYPTTLAPTNPGTLPWLRELYDELLPCFTSSCFNVGCDETWDLGRGQSHAECERVGKGQVYLDFLLQIHREVKARGKRMMFWADIVLNRPEMIKALPPEAIAINWGYEANHPFAKETRLLRDSGLVYYVCPGTSTWMTLIGRHDNAFANLTSAAKEGLRNGASGYLNTDWGDGGHPQPLAVSWAPYVLGAALSWCGKTADASLLGPVLSRDIFEDPSGLAAEAALRLGYAHRQFDYYSPNVTPFGTVLTAPPPKLRELVCRDGLKYFARIPGHRVESALEAVKEQRAVLYRSKPNSIAGEMLAAELDMAARMAEESCQFLLWQQALAGGRQGEARRLARRGVKALREIKHDFAAYWPWRNKGTPAKCTGFLDWRVDDYSRGTLPYSETEARIVVQKTYVAE